MGQVRELQEHWLLALEAEGAASATLQTYRVHSDIFLRQLGEGELNAFSVRAFLAEYGRGRANESLRTVFSTLRSWLRFCVRDGLLPEGALTGLRAPRRVETRKQVYSAGQLQALFRLLEGDRSALGLRNYALCSVLLDGGLRVSETCALVLDSFRDGALVVGPGKSRRMRSVPLGQRSQRAVQRFLASGRPRLKPRSEHLFVGRDGYAINRNTVRLMLTRLSERLGFRLSAHRFRHTWTTVMLRRGADLETLRRLGGWADYSMLLTYSHLTDNDLRAAQARFSPLDGL